MKTQLSNLKKILLFGGSFDPIHYGHLSALNATISTYQYDLILIIPNFISPHKGIINLTKEHKLEMLKIAFKDYENLEIDEYEINNNKSSYFINTLNYLKDKYTNSKFDILIGEDQYQKFDLWKDYKQIISIANKIIVYPRKVSRTNKRTNFLKLKHPIKFKFLKYYLVDISSTSIRDEYIDPTIVPIEVINYINKYGIYATNRVRIRTKKKDDDTKDRYQHSLRVAYMCQELAKKWDENLINQAFIAGIYHDIAKDMPKEEQIRIAENELKIKEYVSWKVLHPYIARHILETQFYFKDELILQAIYRHTLPFALIKTEPTLLDKIVYVADKLEPARTNADVFENPISFYRDLAYKNIDECFTLLLADLQKGLNK